MTTADLSELLGASFAFLLTLAVLSYLLGDNPAYRVAIHIFVGAAAGYAAIIVSTNILYPQFIAPVISIILSGQSPSIESLILNLITPAVLALLLLMKASPSTRFLGSFATAFMSGVGVAVAIGGAVMGTILPQTSATFISLVPPPPPASITATADKAAFALEHVISTVVIIGGTLFTLGSFYYGARAKPGGVVERSIFVKPIVFIGQIFIGLTFGVMYAGALAASLAIFANRILELGSTFQHLIQLIQG
jgi:hypothetical protein